MHDFMLLLDMSHLVHTALLGIFVS